MIRIFKKKKGRKLLEDSYKKLLDQSYKLARTDRKTSDMLAMEAEDLLEKIMSMKESA